MVNGNAIWPLLLPTVFGWTIPAAWHQSTIRKRPNLPHTTPGRWFPSGGARVDTGLSMGLIDSLSQFIQNRQGDFVKLGSSSSEAEFVGPGPLLLVYGIPPTMDEEEIADMVSDGAPVAFPQCKIIRLSPQDDAILNLPLQQALEGLAQGRVLPPTSLPESSSAKVFDIPVLYFSGFQNDEMLAVYNILGKEINEETFGQASPACAKAVPNAMSKPLRQVLDEISGDHRDAIAKNQEDS